MSCVGCVSGWMPRGPAGPLKLETKALDVASGLGVAGFWAFFFAQLFSALYGLPALLGLGLSLCLWFPVNRSFRYWTNCFACCLYPSSCFRSSGIDPCNDKAGIRDSCLFEWWAVGFKIPSSQLCSYCFFFLCCHPTSRTATKIKFAKLHRGMRHHSLEELEK